MNRRDIIVVAVIIHAGLLVSLFAFSLKKTPVVAQYVAEAPSKRVEIESVSQRAHIAKERPLPTEALQSTELPATPAQKEQTPSALPHFKVEDKGAASPPFKPLQKPASDESKKKEGGAEYYVVKAGDNPWTIAHKHQMQVDELLRLNNMDEVKAKHLRPGDRLKIK